MACGFAMVTLVTGCSKDNPLNPAGNCFGGNWAEQYTDELQAWSNAATVYGEDPTPANTPHIKTPQRHI